MRGDILALTNCDVAVPYLQICRAAVAARFNAPIDQIGLDVDISAGRLKPRFSISEEMVLAAGMDREQAANELRGTWAVARQIILRGLARASERWCAFP